MKVYAVTAAAALAWVQGQIDDDALKASAACGNAGEAIFWEWLDDLAEWKTGCAECAKLFAAGAVTLVARTKNKIVARKMEKHGGILCSHDNPPYDPAGRYIVPPPGFARWIKKVRECKPETP